MQRAFLALLIASQGLCQTSATNSDTLQSLLVEVRQLRQNIEIMTVASQRVQIALYTLQSQDAAVVRSAQRLDSVKNVCNGKEEHRQHTAADMQKMDSSIASGKLSPSEAKLFEERAADLKSQLEALTLEVQTCRAGEADAASQLRNDQAVLAELRDRLERLDKILEKPTGSGK